MGALRTIGKRAWSGLTNKETIGMTVPGAIGFGGSLIGNVHAGDDIGTSIVKASAYGMFSAAMPVTAGIMEFGSLGLEVSQAAAKWGYQKTQFYNQQFRNPNTVGGNYVDTQRALTMRQASVQAIQSSKMNARSALGGEAKILNPYARRY